MTGLIQNYNELYNSGKLRMWLDLSTYCNAKCPQCHRTNADGLGKVDWLPLVQWSYDQFVKMFSVKHLQRIEHFDICGTWGDPIMNKDIFKIVEYIIKNTKDTTILLNTNGSFRNENWWWDLGLLGKERIKVMWAVEGITQEQHSLYRQNTNLQIVLNNMESFSLAGGISEIFTVVFKHNENHLYEIAKITKQHGARCIMFIQSNRFYNNMKFDFINEVGEKKVLERSEKENNGFYGSTFNLYNTDHLERIKNESIK